VRMLKTSDAPNSTFVAPSMGTDIVCSFSTHLEHSDEAIAPKLKIGNSVWCGKKHPICLVRTA
jgi:hypothetical protein